MKYPKTAIRYLKKKFFPEHFVKQPNFYYYFQLSSFWRTLRGTTSWQPEVSRFQVLMTRRSSSQHSTQWRSVSFLLFCWRKSSAFLSCSTFYSRITDIQTLFYIIHLPVCQPIHSYFCQETNTLTKDLKEIRLWSRDKLNTSPIMVNII